MFSESKRKTSSAAQQKSRISVQMISRPQNDLRHTGHIGYDGAMFGDVAFIGSNYDKLPVRVDSAESSPRFGREPSVASLLSTRTGSQRFSTVWWNDVITRCFAAGSQDTDTLTDVSSWTGDFQATQSTEDLNEPEPTLDEFKLPDLSVCLVGFSLAYNLLYILYRYIEFI